MKKKIYLLFAFVVPISIAIFIISNYSISSKDDKLITDDIEKIKVEKIEDYKEVWNTYLFGTGNNNIFGTGNNNTYDRKNDLREFKRNLILALAKNSKSFGYGDYDIILRRYNGIMKMVSEQKFK